VVLTGGRRVADKYRRRQSRPGSQSYRRLVVQSLTVSTAAISPRSLLHLTDATIHVAGYAAAFLFTVYLPQFLLLVSVDLINSSNFVGHPLCITLCTLIYYMLDIIKIVIP